MKTEGTNLHFEALAWKGLPKEHPKEDTETYLQATCCLQVLLGRGQSEKAEKHNGFHSVTYTQLTLPTKRIL